MMLAWLMTSVSLALRRMTPRSSSIPITNIKSTKPIWLMILSGTSESGSNRKANVSGDRCPSTDGPSTIPAISPITPGCPRYLKR